MDEQEAKEECRRIWDDDSLQADLAKLVSKGGIDHYALIDSNSQEQLKRLLPSPLQANNVVVFRELVRETMQLQDKKNFLFPYGNSEKEKTFKAKTEDISYNAYTEHISHCTFFNKRDADAAKKIVEILEMIGFLHEDRYGFPPPPQKGDHEKIEFKEFDAYQNTRYTDVDIDKVLRRWEKLKSSKKP